jgi:hypothetical protein
VTFAEIRTARLDLWLEHGPTARAYLAEAVERTDIKLPFKLPKNFPDAKTLAQVGANHLMKHYGFPPDRFHNSGCKQKRKSKYKLENTDEHTGVVLKLSKMYDTLYHCSIPLKTIGLGHYDALAVYSKRHIGHIQKKLEPHFKGGAWLCLELGEDRLQPHVHVLCGPQDGKIERAYEIQVYDLGGINDYLSKGVFPDLDLGRLRRGERPNLEKLVPALVLIGYELELKRRMNPRRFTEDGQKVKRKNLPRTSWSQKIPRIQRKGKPVTTTSTDNTFVFVNEKQPGIAAGNAPKTFTTATAAAHALETAPARAKTAQTTVPTTPDLSPEPGPEAAWAASALEKSICGASHAHDLSRFRKNTPQASPFTGRPIRATDVYVSVRCKGRRRVAAPTGIG